MISEKSINIEWINNASAKNNKADRVLVEKVIRVLLLLEGLTQSEMTFVFKGGTAVMILQDVPKRFSIDADIMVPTKIDFDSFFIGFLKEKGFTRYELHERNSSSNIEKYHYKFYYNPVSASRLKEEYILLDIIVEPPQYSNIVEVDIDSPFVIQESAPITVKVPSKEDILGDKLTAFAPNTTGIPYKKNGFSAAMEIIKQLYDIGNLFDEMTDMNSVASTFKLFAETEMNYRGLSGKINMVLNDIIQTALCISSRGRNGDGDFKLLQTGISQMKSYIFSEPYHIEKAIVHASRAAYCAKLIDADVEDFSRFDNPDQVLDLHIDTLLDTKLNKLKKSNPEEFFYWYQVMLLNNTDGGF